MLAIFNFDSLIQILFLYSCPYSLTTISHLFFFFFFNLHSFNRHLGLDLVPRKDFEMVDADQISVSDLYKMVSLPWSSMMFCWNFYQTLVQWIDLWDCLHGEGWVWCRTLSMLPLGMCAQLQHVFVCVCPYVCVLFLICSFSFNPWCISCSVSLHFGLLMYSI